MTTVKSTDNKKWINALVAVGAILLSYLLFALFRKIGEYADLEAKVQYFHGTVQALSLGLGIIGFFLVVRNSKAVQYLDEVFTELAKVVWPTRDSVTKLTVGIIIGLICASIVLFGIDYVARWLLSLIY